jgi:CBS domain-containing protein
MRVADVMMGTPYSCLPEVNLGVATELMWKGNCGFLPVVDADGKIVGVVTDRDICVALGTRARLPGAITVAEVMTPQVHFCAPEDDIHEALREMREGHVHRLPVVTKNGALVGVISMDDVIMHAESGISRVAELTAQEVVRTLQALNVRQLPQAKSAAA